MKFVGLFSKLMGKTATSNDNEALMAIRRANKMLSEAKITWEEIAIALDKFNDAYPQDGPRKAPETNWEDFTPHGHHTDAQEINRLFVRVRTRNHNASFEAFLDSINDWWLEKGFLTRKQYQRLKAAAEEMD